MKAVIPWVMFDFASGKYVEAAVVLTEIALPAVTFNNLKCHEHDILYNVIRRNFKAVPYLVFLFQPVFDMSYKFVVQNNFLRFKNSCSLSVKPHQHGFKNP